jgi:hypothetical protein
MADEQRDSDRYGGSDEYPEEEAEQSAEDPPEERNLPLLGRNDH